VVVYALPVTRARRLPKARRQLGKFNHRADKNWWLSCNNLYNSPQPNTLKFSFGVIIWSPMRPQIMFAIIIK
jgi:hypothetical protein